MSIPKLRQFGIAVIAFLLGIGFCSLTPGPLRGLVTEGRVEETRVASPDGQFDAVIDREGYGGAAGGFEYYVYIVAKGKVPPEEDGSFAGHVFQAGTLKGQSLIWTSPHLLTIGYDVANIEHFRNLWCLDQIENVGPTGERDFCVEIRLVPSSDSSIVNPDGKFRSQ